MIKRTNCKALVMAALVAVLLIPAAPRELLSQDAGFTVTAGNQTHRVTMDAFVNLGLRDFQATTRGETRTYTGTPIAEILRHLGINPGSVVNLTFIAADGATLTIPAGEVLNPGQGYLTIAEEGEQYTSWEEGGLGPFRLVLAQDQFPQRWIRNVVTININ